MKRRSSTERETAPSTGSSKEQHTTISIIVKLIDKIEDVFIKFSQLKI